MAATVIDHKSTQVSNAEASPIVKDIPQAVEGKLRVKRISYAPPTGTDPVATDNVALAKMRKGQVLLGGVLNSNGAVATATLDVGISAVDGSDDIDDAGTGDDDDFFASALAIATAGVFSFGNTLALKYGYKCLKDVYITGTLNTAGMTGGTHQLEGHVLLMETA